jgi:hypothetical protein
MHAVPDRSLRRIGVIDVREFGIFMPGTLASEMSDRFSSGNERSSIASLSSHRPAAARSDETHPIPRAVLCAIAREMVPSSNRGSEARSARCHCQKSLVARKAQRPFRRLT